MKKTINPINMMNSLLINDTIDIEIYLYTIEDDNSPKEDNINDMFQIGCIGLIKAIAGLS